MKYKCLVFDHDDTVVNSTATIHHPCFVEYLKAFYPGQTISLEDYFLLNFEPGFIPMCRERYGMTDEDLAFEARYWQDYVKNHIPAVYPGIRAIMEKQKAEGGLVCVVSHPFDYTSAGTMPPILCRSRTRSTAGSGRRRSASPGPSRWRTSCAVFLSGPRSF